MNSTHSKVKRQFDVPEEEQERGEDAAEVVVPLDGRRGIEGEGAEQLHAHDGVDEEEHAHQQAHVGKSLQVVNTFLLKECKLHMQPQFPRIGLALKDWTKV